MMGQGAEQIQPQIVKNRKKIYAIRFMGISAQRITSQKAHIEKPQSISLKDKAAASICV